MSLYHTAYTGLQMFMANLKQLIHGNHDPLINNDPSILSQRPQFQLLYQELASIIQTFSNIHQHHLHELQEVQNLKKRFKDAAEEAQDTIDLFVSAVHFTNKGISPDSNIFKASLELTDTFMRNSIESIKVELMAINIDDMKMNSSSRSNRLKTQSAAAGTSCTRNPLGMKKPLMKEIVVGLDNDVNLIRDKLVEDKKKLGVVCIVGMGGLGKTTLATKVCNDPYIVHYFYVRAWVTISQTYEKRDLLVQILTSIGIQEDLEEDGYSQLRGKLHKHLMGKRYLIVIDDIWSIKAWYDLKFFFPDDNTKSRILLTSRLNEVALYANPHGLVHSLPCLKEEQSWELLKQKVFHGGDCPEWSIKPGMQIAKKCQGLPLSVVVMAGILAKEEMRKDLWEKIAYSVTSYIVSDQKGNLETLALSYHHLPHHLRECFLYLGGFPEDHWFNVKRLTRLWVAEGFIEEAGNRSLEDTAKAYLMDLVDRNLVIVAERKFNGDVKACKLHDLVRKLCQEKAKEERVFFKACRPPNEVTPLPIPYEVVAQYKQRRLFTNQDITIVNLVHPPTPSIRSLFYFHKNPRSIDDTESEYFYSFSLLRVLDLQKSKYEYVPQGMALLVHLRYLAIWNSSGFPSSLCNLWSLQTLILKTSYSHMNLPSNISDLVNLRHLWSNVELFLLTIEKPINLQSISEVRYGDGVDTFQKYFPSIKKLAYTFSSGEKGHFELLPYLETLKLRGGFHRNHICYPATLRKLTLVKCRLPWSNMSIIQSLLNLEVLKLKDNAFEGTQWNAREQQFRQLKFLRLEKLNIIQWEAYRTSFPRLKRLAVLFCRDLEEIPLEIGEITTLELIETDNWSESIVESVERIQQEQQDVGNYELKITVDGMELSVYLSKHESSESE
ncbi:putative late blight resistance protein homolog R1A-10 [Cynara cardunculus var. scolymus]|uniref:putative late blight resistance protein homolog R1A-10 n=1 Tax=Cynara cardunculus var. scolymus TaxID=59895 RepID=UPI000D626F8B|nr:putative late blight resistance protein homolog R1A-10 [Cynara cardunculus var. scolymus]